MDAISSMPIGSDNTTFAVTFNSGPFTPDASSYLGVFFMEDLAGNVRNGWSFYPIQVQAVPEPGMVVLAGAGAVFLLLRRIGISERRQILG